MSSTITSESEIDLCSVDMLRRPIKTRSYYNSNNSRNLLRSVETRTTKNSPKGPISWRRQSKDNLWVTATPPNNKSIKEGLAQKRPSMEPVAQLAFGSAPQSNACKKRRSQMVFTSQPKAKSTGSVESSTLLPLATRSSPPLPSPETFQYRKSIDISSNDIGPILGRGGCTIAHIEREYKVSVNLDRHRLLVTVRGCEETQVVSAIADIRKIIKNNTSGAGNFVGGQQIMLLPQSSKLPATNWRSPSFRRSTTDTNATSRTRLSSDVLRAPATEPAVYNEAPEVTALTEQAVIDMRAENDNTMVSVVLNPGASSQNGGDDEQQPHPVIPRPIWLFDQAFAQYGNNWSTLLGERFERPTPIQAQAWPILLQGLDLIGVAQTGTGKTLAYLLPALIQTERQIRVCSGPGPHVLVLVPTRELAAQIDKEMQTFKSSSLRSVLIVGGGDRRAQIDSRSAHFIIGTPGRLIDMLDSHQLNIGRVTFLVLDEADRMLDMGFEHQIKKILRALRTTHQTVMTSATWPQEVRRLARMLTRNPIQVCVGTQHLSTTHSVKQTVCVIQDHDKFPLLVAFLGGMASTDKVIVFCQTKARASDLSLELLLNKYHNACLHGAMEQHERVQALSDIRSGYVRVLIATDLASRGLDIEEVTHVINFDFPRHIDEYVHRVGRTGRAGRTGNSISYFTRNDWAKASQLIRLLEEAEQEVPVELRQMAQRYNLNRQQRRRDNSTGSRISKKFSSCEDSPSYIYQ